MSASTSLQMDDKWKVGSGFWVRIERMVEDCWVLRRVSACFTPLARIALDKSAFAMLNEIDTSFYELTLIHPRNPLPESAAHIVGLTTEIVYDSIYTTNGLCNFSQTKSGRLWNRS